MCTTMAPSRLSLPMDTLAPARARAFLARAACTAHHAQVLACAQLLVSELVTNAVRHGGRFAREPQITVHLQITGTVVHVDVVNEGNGFEPEPPGAQRDGGLGLHLVDRLATRWGVEANGGTKVWLELPTEPGRPAMRSAPAPAPASP